MLDLRKYFSVGEKIHLNYLDAREHLNEYVSQVAEIHGNEFVDVLIPIHRKRDVYLKQDTILKIVVSKEEAVYEFRAVLYEKLFGRIPLLRLKVLSDIKKIQRRDFYRLKIMRDIEVRLVVNLKENIYDEQHICNLLDISVGGLLFNSRKEFQEKDMLELTLDLNGKKLTVFGTIIRRTLNDSYRAPYSYGVKYVNMSSHEREVITKFIYEEQRRMIKKGLI